MEHEKADAKEQNVGLLYFPDLVQYESVDSRERVIGVPLNDSESTLILNNSDVQSYSNPVDETLTIEENPVDESDTNSEYVDTDWPSNSDDVGRQSDQVWSPSSNLRQQNPVETIRRSERIAKQNQQSSIFCAIDCVSRDPETFQEAISSEEADKWNNAMTEEINSLKNKNTWVLAELPTCEKAIQSKWVYKPNSTITVIR